MNIEGKRTQKVIKILDTIAATKYISTPGAQNYLLEDDYASQTKIPLSFLEYPQIKYNLQIPKKFTTNLSIIDMIANVGWLKTESYVKLK